MSVSAVDSVSQNRKYYLPPLEEGLINRALSFEVMQGILSYLNTEDLQSTVLVSRYWKEISIDTAAREISKIQAFARVLGRNLSESSNSIQGLGSQREQLLFIGNQNLSPTSLNEIKSLTSQLKKDILEELKQLKEEELGELEKSSEDEVRPKVFENIFELTRFYREVGKANLIGDKYARGLALAQIIKSRGGGNNALLEEASDKIIEIVNGITFDIIEKIAAILANNGNGRLALEAVDRIPNDHFKGVAAKEIAAILANNGNGRLALEAVDRIPDDYFKRLAAEEIAVILANKAMGD
ncbi:MAG: F-box-like domain-containing protein [Parachlamydiaceae bacterium]